MTQIRKLDHHSVYDKTIFAKYLNLSLLDKVPNYLIGCIIQKRKNDTDEEEGGVDEFSNFAAEYDVAGWLFN